MIIKNASVFSKKQKSFIFVTSIIFDVIVLSIIIASFIVSYISNTNELGGNSYILAILAVIGTVSVGDLFSILSKRKSLSFILIQLIKRHKDPLSKIGIKINTRQLQFCEEIAGSKSVPKLIYVFGKRNKGKSVAVLYLLKSILLNSDSINDVPWFENITFIDCTNNKDEIIDFFLMDNPTANRIEKFNNCLVVLDNIECLGTVFLEENAGLFSSKKSFFILIEDTYMTTPMCHTDMLKNICTVHDFNSSFFSIKRSIDIYKEILKFDPTTKKLIFALYFATLNSCFVKKKTIRKVLQIKRMEFNKSLKQIQKLKLFITFPYNTAYCYFCKKDSLYNIDEMFCEDLIYNSVLNMFVFSNIIDDEIKWLCLIRSSISFIQLVDEKKRHELLNNALYNGNYTGLYNELNRVIKKTPLKSSVFLYEKAYLSFHIGNHKEATTCYMSLINTQNDVIDKKELMLHIIESSHGNQNELNMKMIDEMITDLKLDNDFYAICARYWEIHIFSEKGIFLYVEMAEVRKNILRYSGKCNADLKNSIIQRTFTDEIRFNHILGNECIFSLYEKFDEFLNSNAKSRHEYFKNLYIEANSIHYVSIINSVLEGIISQTELDELVRTADYYYEKALSTNYCDEKSKRAAKAKQADLKMMYCDFDFKEIVQTINMFRLHSQINNVGVHEAYCNTLLMKAYILNPSNFSNEFGINIAHENLREINKQFENAKRIYKEYKNSYGIFRSEFIMNLFELLLSDTINEKASLSKLQQLIGEYPHYIKENKIANTLFQKIKNGKAQKMFVISLIRAYPIILQ